MLPVPDGFEFDYFGSDIVYGRGYVAGLDAYLAARGLERTLLVCGTNVSANEAVMSPVCEGIGGQLTGVFDETTRRSARTRSTRGLPRWRTPTRTCWSGSAAAAAWTSPAR